MAERQRSTRGAVLCTEIGDEETGKEMSGGAWAAAGAALGFEGGSRGSG